MIKLVVTDIDQTLLNDHLEISEENLLAIKELKNKGVRFGVASGRAQHKIEKMMENNGLLSHIDLIIGYNGVTVNDGTVLSSPTKFYLSKDIIRDVYEAFKHHPVTFIVHDEVRIYCNKLTAYAELESTLNQYEIQVQPDFSSFIKVDFPKLMLVGESSALNKVYVEMCTSKTTDYSFFKSHENFLEVVKPEVSKGNILSQYCLAKEIALEEVMAIGDNLNDLEMIKVVGYGVAVSNAVEEVKEAARWISTSNNESAVAKAIKKFVE